MHTFSHIRPVQSPRTAEIPVLNGDLGVGDAPARQRDPVHARLQMRWTGEDLQEGGRSVRRLCLQWDVVGRPWRLT
jgi:hypothetical protein